MRKSGSYHFISRQRWRTLLLIAAFRECCFSACFFVADAFFPNGQRQRLPFDGSYPFVGRLFTKQLDSFEEPSNKMQKLLSEIDAVRILRAQPRPTKTNTTPVASELNPEQSARLTACKSALHVLQILEQTSSKYRESDRVESIIVATKPNVAAAALRRLLSPPFLPVSFATTKKGIQYINKQPMRCTDVSESEKKLYIQLMSLLQKKLFFCIDSQLEALLLSNIDSDKLPVLLHKNSTLENPPASTSKARSFQLNWYALADLLFASSVLRNLHRYQRGEQSVVSRNLYLQSIVEAQFLTEEKVAGSVSDTFGTLIRYLSFNNEIASSFVRSVGPKRVVRDVLLPITVVQYGREQSECRENDDDDDDFEYYEAHDEDDQEHSDGNSVKTGYILEVISSYLSLPHCVEALNCAELSTTLWCYAQIYQPASNNLFYSDRVLHEIDLGDIQLNLIRLFMKRLRKGSIHSMGSGRDIAQAIWSTGRLIGLVEYHQLAQGDQQWEMEGSIELPDGITFPGESSKPNSPVDSSLSSDENKDIVDSSKLNKDATIMVYTLTKELLKTSSNWSSYNKLSSLNLQQVTDVLQASISLNMHRNDLVELLRSTIGLLTTEADSPKGVISQCNSCIQIARMLWSLQRLRVGSGDSLSPHTEAYCVELLGNRFLALVLRDLSSSNHQCKPKTLVTTLRSSVMMFPGDSRSTDAIFEAASHLILPNDTEDELDFYRSVSNPFLLECNEYEVSNLLFAFALKKRFDEAVYLQLTAHMLEADILDECSASSASRAMWSSATLLQEIPPDCDESFKFYQRQVDLFHQLSGVLLTSPLSPTDCSSAMWAMAKSTYALDKGCFDFIAQRLATMLEMSNVRLVAQALWSCSKMAKYESSKTPPYMDSVDHYLTYIIANGQKMTPLQISKTIYALGSLRVSNRSVAKELAALAMEHAEHFNCQEVANVAWGLSKVDYNDEGVMLKLVRHVTETRLLSKCSTQEASNMLYALGKLQIKDVDAYRSLSTVLMSELQNASSQAIANALWAYDVVGIEAPVELMNCWAREKLGMNAFSELIESDDVK